ncbi:ABC transporter permease [Crossiella sp. CA-258035]|uniref:ABC transporter permease n=1 Tax=Crossiella sp. CA-258035 TaxID=2981138 RepID=UPI0024BCABA3|nr:ABC transporter permease [Crossiella sp. CA-258035]WHT22592.1 ABC transporter permease [Crossiella sp. CA-258035]
MPGFLTALARNDMRGARRDLLVSGVLLAPLVWIAAVRFGTPLVTRFLAERYRFDLVPHYPLVLVGFLLLTSAIVIGAVVGLLVLEERDAGTLIALQVSPLPMRAYLGYRGLLGVTVTAVYVLATMSASDLLPWRLLLPLVPIALLTGCSALVVTLVILLLAKNKVEGIAVVRALGIVVAGLPLLPTFLDTDWDLAFGLVPSYWPAQAFLTAAGGGAWWPYLVAGLAYHGLLIALLYRGLIRGGSAPRPEA